MLFLVFVRLFLGLQFHPILSQAAIQFGKAACGLSFHDQDRLPISGQHPASYKSSLWPTSRIPYELVHFHREADIREFEMAIEEFHEHTCLRFELRAPSDTNYMRVQMIFDNLEYCGTANICFQEDGPLHVNITHDCSSYSTFIHQIGHALCLRHENRRPDRNKFLTFSECTNPSRIPRMANHDVLAGLMYDYNSIMHPACLACNGRPTISGALLCGSHEGLSIIDSDRLNDLYNCSGCLRHKWYNATSLTNEQRQRLVNLASQKGDKDEIYICRCYDIMSEISVGRYVEKDKACLVVTLGVAYNITERIELMALPSPDASYKLVHISEYSKRNNFIRAGRSIRKYTAGGPIDMHVAVAVVEGSDGDNITLVGKLYRGMWNAHFHVPGGKVLRLTYPGEEFKVYACVP